MARKAIKYLRSFFKAQAKECTIAPPDELEVIQQILREPNPGVIEAQQKGIPYTIAEGDTIYRINPDNTRVEIGKVKSKEVEISLRTITAR